MNPKIRLVKDVFNKENTDQFLLELDLVLRTADVNEVKKLLLRYQIQEDPECEIFISEIKDIFENWKIPNYDSTLVDEVETRNTKCYACFLGKTVRAYEFYYQHKRISICDLGGVYAREFAIYTDIQKNKLVDFGICHGFLVKDDILFLDNM